MKTFLKPALWIELHSKHRKKHDSLLKKKKKLAECDSSCSSKGNCILVASAYCSQVFLLYIRNGASGSVIENGTSNY